MKQLKYYERIFKKIIIHNKLSVMILNKLSEIKKRKKKIYTLISNIIFEIFVRRNLCDSPRLRSCLCFCEFVHV